MAVTVRSLLPLVLLLATQARAMAADVPQSTLASGPSSNADSPREIEAEDRRQRALRFYDSGNYAAAREEFERANQLLPSFRLLYNLGVVSMALGDSAAAYDFFQGYLSGGGSAVPDDVRAEVRGQLHDLAEHIATIVVRVDATNAAIFIDDTRAGSSPLGPVHVNAGFRRISARMPGSQAEQVRTLEVHGGETVSVRLTLAPPPRKPAPTSRPVFWAGWASTLVLAAGASFAGLEALSTQHEYQTQFGMVGPSRAELDRLDRRTTVWSVTADTLGAAAIAVGTYSLYVTLRSASSRPITLTDTQVTPQLNANQARFAVRF